MSIKSISQRRPEPARNASRCITPHSNPPPRSSHKIRHRDNSPGKQIRLLEVLGVAVPDVLAVFPY